MESTTAIDRLSALAHPGRLAVFRLLVRAGPEGLAAGEVASRLGAAPNTLSAQFNILVQAGLVTGAREGRVIRYAARTDAVRELIVYLMQDCCDGQPELCQSVQDAARAACCPPQRAEKRRTAKA